MHRNDNNGVDWCYVDASSEQGIGALSAIVYAEAFPVARYERFPQLGTGRYVVDATAPPASVFFCGTQIHISGASEGYFRALIALNGVRDTDNGLHTVRSGLASIDTHVSVAFLLWGRATTCRYGHTSQDSSYVVTMGSGFSCAALPSDDGFAADLLHVQPWDEITAWSNFRRPHYRWNANWAGPH